MADDLAGFRQFLILDIERDGTMFHQYVETGKWFGVVLSIAGGDRSDIVTPADACSGLVEIKLTVSDAPVVEQMTPRLGFDARNEGTDVTKVSQPSRRASVQKFDIENGPQRAGSVAQESSCKRVGYRLGRLGQPVNFASQN